MIEEETNVKGRVEGTKRLEWPIKVIQQIIELLLHVTKLSDMPYVIEVSSKGVL